MSVQIVEESQRASFNGGKMEHIFVVDKTSYVPNFHSDEAKKALEQGQLYWKIDGACGLIRYNSDTEELEAYERQDTRGKPPDESLVPLPAGNNDTEHNQHSYYMRKVEIGPNEGKKMKRIKLDMLQILTDHREALLKAIQDHSSNGSALTVEWVGTKFQKTPGVPYSVGLILHCEQNVELDEGEQCPKTFEGAKDFLAKRAVEGLVIRFQGRYWKIRSNMILEKNSCEFDRNKSSVPPPCNVFYVKASS